MVPLPRAASVDNIAVKAGGTVKLHNLKTVIKVNGNYVAVSRSGELAVLNEAGRERERYKVPYGAVLVVGDGDVVEGGKVVANWDPHTHPVVSEVAGKAAFSDIVDGVTVQQQVDEVTGLTRMEVMTRSNAVRPRRSSGPWFSSWTTRATSFACRERIFQLTMCFLTVQSLRSRTARK